MKRQVHWGHGSGTDSKNALRKRRERMLCSSRDTRSEPTGHLSSEKRVAPRSFALTEALGGRAGFCPRTLFLEEANPS